MFNLKCHDSINKTVIMLFKHYHILNRDFMINKNIVYNNIIINFKYENLLVKI